MLAPLSRYILKGIEDCDEIIGHGSYAVVKKLNFRGLECVGKKIHDILYLSATPQQQLDILARFEGECELLSQLMHPCIVQFMGVYFEGDTPLPVLVMERLHSTLASAIDRHGVLPDQISYSVLREVCLGLRYLHEHSPAIIHRDLTANNVLLTPNMNAKISDLGVAKMLNSIPIGNTPLVHTKAPGTPCYMPPEAMVSQPQYNTKIDIYSMGVMCLHVLSGRWPFPTDAFRPDPLNSRSMLPVTEVERRAAYITEIGHSHPLTSLITDCLSNNQFLRPSAAEVHSRLQEVESDVPPLAETRAELLHQLHNCKEEVASMEKYLSKRVKEIEEERGEISSQRSQGQRVSLIHPHSVLHWRRRADMPVAAVEMQAVAMGDHVYMGGGVPHNEEDFYAVCRYDISNNEWFRLTDHSVAYFGLGEFHGRLISVGGSSCDTATSNIFQYSMSDKKWVDFLSPMPTARANPTVITTSSAIVSCGGNARYQSYYEPVSTVEVYCDTTDSWYTAESLPQLSWLVSSVVIDGTAFLLGGFNACDAPIRSVFTVNVETLIERAKAPTNSTGSIWRTLPDTKLKTAAAASLGGSLLALGGYDDDDNTQSSTYVYAPFTDSWLRLLSGDLPDKQYESTAVQLSNERVMVVGGRNSDEQEIASCFIGSIITRS